MTTKASKVVFATMVAALIKSGQDILDSLTPSKCHSLHMGFGIAGEAGELVDAIKKYIIYNKPVDRENVVEEFGDLEFYMEGLRVELGITRDECLEHNIKKLLTSEKARYKLGTYTDAQAQDRADKQ
jgi:NTP pyrophosphatase (non-canonical NTP hydrolase)